MPEASKPSRIKPPQYHLTPPDAIPRLRTCAPKEAVSILFASDVSKRHVTAVHIKDLRDVITLFIESAPDWTKYWYISFMHCVIERADITDLTLPLRLGFSGCYFIDELDFSRSHIYDLYIGGHYIKGNLGLVYIRDCKSIQLANCQIDSIYCFNSEIKKFDIFGCRTANPVVIAHSKDIYRLSCSHGCDFYNGMFIQRSKFQNLSVENTESAGKMYFDDTDVADTCNISNCLIKGSIDTRNASFNVLSLHGTSILGACDLRSVQFDKLDVSNFSAHGEFYLERNQLVASESKLSRLLPANDRKSKIEIFAPNSHGRVQDQLYRLKEIFHSSPASFKQEDYCLYRIMEIHRKRSGASMRVGMQIVRFGFGYLLSPFRTIILGIVAIILFAIIIWLAPFGEITTELGDSVKDDLAALLQVSAQNFLRLNIPNLYIDHIALEALFVLQAGLGVLYVPILTIVLAKKLLRW